MKKPSKRTFTIIYVIFLGFLPLASYFIFSTVGYPVALYSYVSLLAADQEEPRVNKIAPDLYMARSTDEVMRYFAQRHWVCDKNDGASFAFSSADGAQSFSLYVQDTYKHCMIFYAQGEVP